MAAVVSVQFGGDVAATLVPVIGAAGSVVLRLGIGAVVLLAVARPTLRGHSASAWRTVVLFGLVLGAMNWSFYASLDRLHIGVAVTIEFIGPLTLAAVQSRRVRDLLAVAAAAAGILLISQAVSYTHLDVYKRQCPGMVSLLNHRRRYQRCSAMAPSAPCTTLDHRVGCKLSRKYRNRPPMPSSDQNRG